MFFKNEFRVVMSVTICTCKRCSVRLYLQLFVVGLMSYLRYLCLFSYSGVQHILCYVFVFLDFVLCTLCCQFLWIVYFCSSLRRFLTFYLIYELFIMLLYIIDAIRCLRLHVKTLKGVGSGGGDNFIYSCY